MKLIGFNRIKRDKTVHMTDAQWLRAIERYDNNEDRRRGRTFTDGGARELAGELQHLAKEQPTRFVTLLGQIPDEAHQTYVSHILLGLAESGELDDEVLGQSVLSAHARPNRPFGSDIARLIEKQPRIAANPTIFEVLVWYVERGDANGEDVVDLSNAEREIATIDDLMNDWPPTYSRNKRRKRLGRRSTWQCPLASS